MRMSNKLPKSFFEKSRPIASKNSLEDLIPFKFTNDKKIKNGEYRDKKIIKLAK